MTDIYKTTKAKESKSNAYPRASTRASILSDEALLPAIIEPYVAGKTVLAVVIKGSLKGLFTRTGLAFPMKEKHSKCKSTLAFDMWSKSTPTGLLEDGVYFSILSCDLPRSKFKPLISPTRGTPIPEKLSNIAVQTARVTFTGHTSLKSFNDGDTKCDIALSESLNKVTKKGMNIIDKFAVSTIGRYDEVCFRHLSGVVVKTLRSLQGVSVPKGNIAIAMERVHKLSSSDFTLDCDKYDLMVGKGECTRSEAIEMRKNEFDKNIEKIEKIRKDKNKNKPSTKVDKKDKKKKKDKNKNKKNK